MKALVFRHSLARVEDVGELPLPGDDWVRVETTCSGLCGSDVKQIVVGGLDLTPVITHRFALDRWAQAVLTVKNARQTSAVKVLLEPSLRP